MIQLAMRSPDQTLNECRLFLLQLHNADRDNQIFLEMSEQGRVPSEVKKFGLKLYPKGFYLEAVAIFIGDDEDANNFSELELKVLH